MFGKLLSVLFNTGVKVVRSNRGGHHRRAISQGLRLGSSAAGKVMASWRVMWPSALGSQACRRLCGLPPPRRHSPGRLAGSVQAAARRAGQNERVLSSAPATMPSSIGKCSRTSLGAQHRRWRSRAERARWWRGCAPALCAGAGIPITARAAFASESQPRSPLPARNDAGAMLPNAESTRRPLG